MSSPEYLEPLYTADEMRAAEQGHDVEELMERAGRAVADEVLRRFPDARRIAGVCGQGANGGDGRIALRILREHGREAEESDEPRRARTSCSTRSSAPASTASRDPRRPR